MTGKRKSYKRYGVGINDANYNTKDCMFMRKWGSMLQRCYSKNYQKRKPTYVGCTVCDEWLTFSGFKSWMEKQDWEGKHLDKDLLVEGNNVYSPDTCMFVRPEVNSFLAIHRNEAELPLGVSKPKGSSSYICQCSDGKGKKVYLGSHNTPEDAHNKWQVHKMETGLQLMYEETDDRVIKSLQETIEKLFYDIFYNRVSTVQSLTGKV